MAMDYGSRLIAVLRRHPDLLEQIRAEFFPDVAPPLSPATLEPRDVPKPPPETMQVSRREARQRAEVWATAVFPVRPKQNVAYIPREYLDWSLAVDVVQVLYRGKDLYLLDLAGQRQVVMDTDIGLAWECSLDLWGAHQRFQLLLSDRRAMDHLIFVF